MLENIESNKHDMDSFFKTYNLYHTMNFLNEEQFIEEIQNIMKNQNSIFKNLPTEFGKNNLGKLLILFY